MADIENQIEDLTRQLGEPKNRQLHVNTEMVLPGKQLNKSERCSLSKFTTNCNGKGTFCNCTHWGKQNYQRGSFCLALL